MEIEALVVPKPEKKEGVKAEVVTTGERNYIAYVEVTSLAKAAAKRGFNVESREEPVVLYTKSATLLILDHHGPLAHKKSASRQAYEWAGWFHKVPGRILTEPPLDADQVLAVLQLAKGESAPKEVVEGVDLEDRKSAVALWHSIRQGRKELGASVPVMREINRVNEKHGGPWFDSSEEFAEALKRAMEAVSEVIEDIKDGEIDPVKEGERWAKEFEEWAEKQCRDQDIIEETVIAGYKVTFAEAPPTALYVKGTDVAVSYGNGRVTVGISPISDLDVDLRELFKFMNEKHRPGWGGRPDVGGSPKDYTIDRKEFEEEIVPLIKRWLERKLG